MTTLKVALDAAAQIMEGIIPKTQPNFPGFDIYGRLSSYYRMGGDFYDYHTHGDKLGIAVVDVVGKGLEAALTSLSTHASLHAYAHTNHDRNVVEIVDNVDKYLKKITRDLTFATLIYGELNPNGVFNYCIAGHESPIVCSNGRVMTVDQFNISKANTVLGMFSDEDFRGLEHMRGYDAFSLRLKPGDVMALYSDGLVDSIGSDGAQKLSELIKTNSSKSAKEISEEVFSRMKKYRKIDDQTLVVVKRN